MGKATRTKAKKFLEPRSRDEVEKRLKELRVLKVRPETREQYVRELKKQEEFLAERGIPEMDAELFGDFVVGLKADGLSGRTAAHHMSAWLHSLYVAGVPQPAEATLKPLYDAISGMIYRGGECPGVPRGAMDSGQLMQLRYHCAINGHTMEADAFAAIWYGMVRHGAAAAASVHDIRMYAAKGPLWHLPMKKALRATRVKAENLSHFKEVHNLRSLFRHLTKGRRPEEKLFPGWSKARARALIREASLVFGWDPTVDWSGPHTMRNGAAQEVRACLKDKVGSVMKRAIWSAVASAVRYRKLRGLKAVKGTKKWRH